MATYLVLNVVFFGVVLLALRLLGARVAWKNFRLYAAVLVLTLLFDNVIIGLGIVGYDDAKILGLYLGRAPIEDFGYAVAAVILLPTVWNRLGKK